MIHLTGLFSRALILFFLFWVGGNSLSAQNANSYFQTGVQMNQQGDFGKALDNFNSAIALSPTNPEFYAHRGYAYSRLFLSQKAKQDFDKALQYNPENLWVLGNRGTLGLQTGNYEQAILDFQQLIIREPDNAWNYFMMGEAKYNARKMYGKENTQYSYFEIVSDYSKAIELDNKFAYAFSQRAEARMDSLLSVPRVPQSNELNFICNDWIIANSLGVADAIRSIDENCEDRANYLQAEKAWNLIEPAFSAKQYKIALGYCDQIIQMGLLDSPYFRQSLFQRAEIKRVLQDYEGAIQDYSTFLSISQVEDFWVQAALYRRGWAQMKLEKWVNARQDFDLAIQGGYQNSWIYKARGTCFSELGEKEAACEDWNEALRRGDQEVEALVKENCKKGLFDFVKKKKKKKKKKKP